VPFSGNTDRHTGRRWSDSYARRSYGHAGRRRRAINSNSPADGCGRDTYACRSSSFRGIDARGDGAVSGGRCGEWPKRRSGFPGNW